MRDYEIRIALRQKLFKDHTDMPDTKVIDEVGLLSQVRVDMLVVNSCMTGYEIKSEKDTLDRLPLQQEVYSQVFDKIVIVTERRHIYNVIEKIPAWWGIWDAIEEKDGEVRFDIFREAKVNPDINPQSLVQCLWREEALNALKEKHIERGVMTKPRSIIWDRVVDNYSKDELKELVCQNLKARHNWRPGQQQKTGDD
jgi:hypothetical protein